MIDQPLRIGILTHVKHPIRQPFAGGLEAFTYDVTLALRKKGHTVMLFASSDSASELDAVAILDDESYLQDGNRGPKEAFFEEYLNEHRAYMDCMQQIDSHHLDVIFNNALHYVPLMMADLVKTPMLTVLHTPPFFELKNAIRAIAQQPPHTQQALPFRPHRFCTVSEANAKNWLPWVPECAVIPNGIDLSLWHPSQDIKAPITSHPHSSTTSSAVWFGRLVRDKGAHLAMDAARIAGMPIVLAGQATDAAYFAQEIAPRLSDTAVYRGHLERDALVTLVQEASVTLVTPCWDEPFGLVVAESLACGTPVAAFARGALPQLLTPLTGMIVPPGDVAALAAAAVGASQLDRQDCRAAAEQAWSLNAMIDRYERLLRLTAARSVAENA